MALPVSDLKVVEPLTPVQEEVRDSIVEILDAMRMRALKGELAGVAIATVEFNRGGEGGVGSVISKTTDRPALFGAVHVLAHRMLDRGV